MHTGEASITLHPAHGELLATSPLLFSTYPIILESTVLHFHQVIVNKEANPRSFGDIILFGQTRALPIPPVASNAAKRRYTATTCFRSLLMQSALPSRYAYDKRCRTLQPLSQPCRRSAVQCTAGVALILSNPSHAGSVPNTKGEMK